ncbi:Hypothetical_protein [Hexamita inflata]|uniref:Hypothetical_protein n=1 Tax=Hexamita inflata TaxID=28002 RepID=A0AA86VCA6_9EUKA|nr:Hypothetical protein HINF_LOCUS50298 [Hexamita inflata]CAI9962657.1 Hypothetical protein HINF_LOCUS50302 [Hexamita inflata]
MQPKCSTKSTQTDDQSMILTGASPSATCPDRVQDSQREFAQQEPTAVETQKQCRRNASFEFKFEGLIFTAIKEYFSLEQFENLQDALLYQRQYTVGAINGKASRVRMNFQKIAVECEITEKQCKDKFQQLVAKELSQPWPEEIVAAVRERIEQLWQYPSANKEEKIRRIKTILEDEFEFKQKVQYNRQDMANIINYKIKQLEK